MSIEGLTVRDDQLYIHAYGKAAPVQLIGARLARVIGLRIGILIYLRDHYNAVKYPFFDNGAWDLQRLIGEKGQ